MKRILILLLFATNMCFGQAIIPVNTGNNSSSFTNAMFNNTLGIPYGVNNPSSTFYRPGNLFYFTGVINKLAVYNGSTFGYLLSESLASSTYYSKSQVDALIPTDTNFIQNQTATPQSGGFNVTATTFHQGGIQTNEFVRYMRGSFGVDIQSPASLSNYYTQLLQALNGTLALTIQPGDIEITDATKGIILKSPNGTRWRVTVGDTGVLTTTSIP